jgi:hypothetical protein
VAPQAGSPESGSSEMHLARLSQNSDLALGNAWHYQSEFISKRLPKLISDVICLVYSPKHCLDREQIFCTQ